MCRGVADTKQYSVTLDFFKEINPEVNFCGLC